MKFPSIKLIFQYIVYRFSAKSSRGHGIHSPFVFDFTQKVLSKKSYDSKIISIERIRKNLLKQQELISHSKFGAGAKFNIKPVSISSVVCKQSVTTRFGQILFNLCRWMNSQNVLEIGTSIGVSTMYLASACENGKVITLEGEARRIAIAKSSIEDLGLTNVDFIQGDFAQTIPLVLKNCVNLDFVFFDGNHTKEATLSYFKLCLSKVHEDSVFVFDDIRWSNEMLNAWNEIISDSNITISIDLFKMGIVFFRKGIIKQHFNINY